MDEKEFMFSISVFSEPWYIVGMKQAEDAIEIKLDYYRGTKFRCPVCGKFCTQVEKIPTLRSCIQ
ncbi:MAG: hypothetical protein LBC12_01540 [Nitrososphaerota archaeon]|jgi:hypothetical protein|nr:hypothetical protein [Nitrososphaerota archaeon]